MRNIFFFAHTTYLTFGVCMRADLMLVHLVDERRGSDRFCWGFLCSVRLSLRLYIVDLRFLLLLAVRRIEPNVSRSINALICTCSAVEWGWRRWLSRKHRPSIDVVVVVSIRRRSPSFFVCFGLYPTVLGRHFRFVYYFVGTLFVA